MTARKKKIIQTPERRGRPRLVFKKAMGDRICREVSLGKSLRRILKGKGMPSMATVMNWLQDVPKFTEQYAHARRVGMELHIDGLLDLADTANSENAHAVRLRVDVRKWLASKMLPKVYGERLELEGPMRSLDSADYETPAGRIEAARRVAFVIQQGVRAAQEKERRERFLLPASISVRPGSESESIVDAEFRDVSSADHASASPPMGNRP